MKYYVIAGLLALASCGGPDAPDGDTETDTASAPEAPAPSEPVKAEPQTDPLDAGVYCYFRDDENVTEGLEITVTDDGGVSGENYGTIHQEAAGYYASFTTTLTEGQTGETADVTFETVTEVDGDTQMGSAIWELTPEAAAPDGLDTLLASADCDGLQDRVFPPVEE